MPSRFVSRTLNFLAAASLLLAGSLAAAATTLLVIGDTGDCRTPGADQVARAMRQQPDWRHALLVETGDLAYPDATRERLLECHEPHFGEFPRRVAVPGNHDWRDPGAAGFFSIFPEALPRVVPLGGPWQLLLLDSNLHHAAWQAQLGWLDQTLINHAGQCLIAVWHHPRYSSGHHGDNEFVAPLWERIAGIAAISLHGHDHHYEALPALDRSGQASATGTRAFISGNGGSYLYAPGDTARSDKAIYNTWGFLRIDLSARRYTWQAFDTTGRALDRGAGECLPALRGQPRRD